ncbi:MAG: acyl-CoA synthetase FdrA [Negativicutes bacterium]|nr:acyl-CoA synthetase FdrA [Negativicutes bacterium]
MPIKTIIRKNAYHDSVTLMAISGKISVMAGVSDAVVAMATAMNKELLERVGMLSAEVAECEANDLVIAVKADTDEICGEAAAMVDELLTKRTAGGGSQNEQRPATVASAVTLEPELNLAIISTPGCYAAREAMQALKNGLHVMMFSDNVTVEEEIALKEYAHDHGLLMMGPDCGTAIVNQVGLCFANVVRAGDIGVIGASGTGTQEVTVLIDQFGGGVSQVLGTGGRDLSEAVGGIMMLDCLAALGRDENTSVIVLISKPPAQAVADKILAEVKKSTKPVVVCFINGDPAPVEQAGAIFGGTLEATARKAVLLSLGQPAAIADCEPKPLLALAAGIRAKLRPEQKYVRGLFCGGTLCDEALHIVKAKTGRAFSNVAKDKESRLSDPHTSKENSFIDLGDDVFTVGRPHPMIEPSLRLPRVLAEARDPEVAVLLLDVELGFGSHEDPAGMLLPAIREAQETARREGRHLEIIAYVCGTAGDKQDKAEQERKLAEAGVTLVESNARGAYLAAAIVAGGGVNE